MTQLFKNKFTLLIKISYFNYQLLSHLLFSLANLVFLCLQYFMNLFQLNSCSKGFEQLWFLCTITFSKMFLLRISLILFRQQEALLNFVNNSIYYAYNSHYLIHLTLKTIFLLLVSLIDNGIRYAYNSHFPIHLTRKANVFCL